MNWRAKLFFHSTDRVHKRIWRFQENYATTGRQPDEMTQKEIGELVADLDYSWFEKVIVNPIAFNAIVRFIIITLAVVNLRDPRF